MEKDRSTRVLSIIAMVLAVVGLTVGFAVFSATLNIQFGSTAVHGDEENFSVKLSSSETLFATDSVTGTVSPSPSGPTALKQTLNETTISNLGATFNKPGEKVTYTFYAVNDGQFDAFLKSINVEDVAEAKTAMTCTADATTDATMVANACKGIKMTVNVDSSEAATITSESTSATASHTIEYQASSAIADGSFTVKFGNVKLNYSTQAS